MTREQAHELIDKIFDEIETTSDPDLLDITISKASGSVEPARVLPEGKRVVRTKSTGDRVYMLTDADNSRRWITNPEVLKGLGFEMGDITEVDDSELMKYTMGPALYRVPTEDN